MVLIAKVVIPSFLCCQGAFHALQKVLVYLALLLAEPFGPLRVRLLLHALLQGLHLFGKAFQVMFYGFVHRLCRLRV